MNKGTAKGPGIFCATVGLSAVVTAGFGWLEVLAGWAIGAVLRWITPEAEDTGGDTKAAMRLLCCGVLLLGVLMIAEKAFPQDSTFPFVSMGLLFLLYRTLIGEKETGRMVSNLLGLILTGMFGGILLLEVPRGHIGELAIQEFRWEQVWITAVISVPWWWERQAWGWYALSGMYSVGISVFGRMILGSALTEYSSMPFYRAAQAIEVMGTTQHMEGVVAVGVLMGAYSMLCQIGVPMSRSGDILRKKFSSRIWWGVIMLVVLMMEWGYRMLEIEERTRMTTVFWGSVGIIALLVVILRKMKKVLDK